MSATTEGDRLRAVIAMQAAVNDSGLDAQEVMQLVVSRAQALTGAVGAAVELLEGDELVTRAAAGVLGSRAGGRRAIGTCAAGHAVRTGDVVVGGGAAAVPIVHRGGPIGVLEVVASAGGGFEAADVDTLEILAGFVTQVLRSGPPPIVDHEQAMLDPLTGLANRALLEDRLAHAVARAHRHGSSIGVLELDIDGFDAVNLEHGRAAGDEVLIVVGHRLLAAIRTSDTAARIGDDEFVVLCEPLVDTTHLAILARRLDAAIRSPIELPGGAVRLGVTIGAAVTTGEKADAAELLRCADEAMFRNKQERSLVGF